MMDNLLIAKFLVLNYFFVKSGILFVLGVGQIVALADRNRTSFASGR